VPAAQRALHVGGQEYGTARVIESIIDLTTGARLASLHRGPLPFREVVRRAVSDVRASCSHLQHAAEPSVDGRDL
jgi:hypothetical protein